MFRSAARLLTLCLLSSLFATAAFGQTNYYWDPGLTGATSPSGGAGNWGTASATWYNGSSTGNLWPNDASVSTDIANFGGTAGTVSLVTNVSANELAFSVDGYSITGSNTITLAGSTPTISVTSGDTATISTGIAGTVGLSVAGSGTLVLTGPNTYTGTTSIGSGSVLKLQGAAFSTTPGTYSIASGAVLNTDGTTNVAAGTTSIAGAGTWRITGGTFGDSAGPGCNITLSLGGGALIDIQSGATLQNGGWQNINWTNNFASMNVASGATFDVWDGNSPQIDALNGSGTITIGINGGLRTLTFGISNGSGTFSGSIQDGVAQLAVQKVGVGTQTLINGMSYTGGTTVSGGTLIMQDTRSGSSNFTVNSPGILDFNFTAGVQQLNGGTINGTGNLVKDGNGQMWVGANGSPETISLTGANSVIEVKAGLLRNEYGNSAWGSNLAALQVDSGATFDTWDGNTTVDYLSGSGTINKAWVGTNSLTIGVNNGSGTFSGSITSNSGASYGGLSGGVFNLIKTGSGAQSLTGSNSYNGTTTVSAGILSIGQFTGGSGAAGSNTALSTGDVSVMAGAQLVFANTGLNIANNITLNGMTDRGALIGGLQTGGVSNTLSGTLTLAATSNVSTFWNDKTLTIAGQVTGAGGLVVDNYNGGAQPGGVIVLSNSSNNYQGDTTIYANKNGQANPILRAGAAGVIPSGGAAGNVNVNGQLDLNGFSQSINGLNGIGTVDSSSAGAPTLTIGGSNASGNFAGVIQNSGGTVSLTKTGSGVQVLSNANTYSGATNITGGTLRLGVQLPSSLPTSNLQTWFDATDAQTLTLSGGNVTSVANRAGPDSASQANAGNQPTLNSSNAAFHGLPTLTFSGNQHLNGFNTSYLNGSSYTIFTVAAVNAGGQQYILGSNSGGGNTSLHYGYRGTNDFTLAQYANDLDYYSAQGYNGSSEVAMDWSGRLDTSSGHAIYYNGGSSVASNGNTDAFNSQTTTSGILGAGFGNNAPFNGDVGEVLIFNSALSDAQRAAVDAYLQTKWGIGGSSSWTSTVLPSNTPVTISNGGILNLNGGNQTIGSVASSDPTTQVQLGAGTLTVGNDGTSTAYAGTISGIGA